MSYFESRLRINFDNLEEVRQTLNFCEQLGIKNLILEPIKNSNNYKAELLNKIKKITNLNIYYRFNLRPSNLNVFKKTIKKFNSFPHILGVETPDKEIQIQAAKDSRIDILSFSNENIMKTISIGVISLIKQNNSFIEFSLAPIMMKSIGIQSKNFRNLYRFTKLVLDLKPNYIISGNFSELYQFRNPRSLLSICHTLLGMSLDEAKKGFRDNVQLLLERANHRVNKNIYQEGVKFIKGGDNGYV
ncbi:MAG: RNase P subunit p30 family protein [Promethearchaeota archaeon]